MKTQHRRSAVTCLACISFISAAMAQDASRKKSAPEAATTQAGQRASPVSPEEKIVRAVYDKLSMLSRAAQVGRGPRPDSPPDESLVLKFELRDFRVGPVREILSTPDRDIATLPSGDIVIPGRVVLTVNKGPEHVGYEGEWGQANYASMYDRQWTVADVFALDPARYHDVGRYATYEVTVSLRGKSRTYRALALFHNAYGSDEPLKPDFWDSIVGMGGVLNEVWNEKRPPIGEKRVAEPAEGAPALAPADDAPAQSQTLESSAASFWTESYSETPSVSEVVAITTDDYTEHESGSHGMTAKFQGACSEQSGNQQLCRVNVVQVHTWETGTTANWFYVHVLRTDKKDETGTGPRGELVSCTAARGVAVKNCLNRDCVYTASLSGSGTSVTMSGGDVWNGQAAHKHTCRLLSPVQQACTTQGFDGSCPDGTYPDGSGMCCSGGSCTTGTFRAAAGGDAPSTNRPPGIDPSPYPGGCGCDDSERLSCYGGGGEWSETSCSCVSPVLVDVLGDGFALTDGAGGVPFDITADGVPDRISWTEAGADDAWLALDRNGNGLVDSGAELFGNFTPQPAPPEGEERNGFLALAVFDRAGNGGNEDGMIDAGDAIFMRLRLWQDVNHDGVSQPAELHTLPALGLDSVGLDYKESKRTDEHGNRFRYRAKVRDVRGAKVNRWAWDVYLVRGS